MSQTKNLNTMSRLTRRNALAGLSVAAAAGVAALPVGAAEVDPIFAVIASHKEAVEVHVRDIHEFDQDTPAESYERCDAALLDVLTVQPTTLAGVAALLAHVALPDFLEEPAPEHQDERETFLSTLNNDGGGNWKRAAQDFPVRLAETVRSLIGGQA
jgi:hypothetical protein